MTRSYHRGALLAVMALALVAVPSAARAATRDEMSLHAAAPPMVAYRSAHFTLNQGAAIAAHPTAEISMSYVVAALGTSGEVSAAQGVVVTRPSVDARARSDFMSQRPSGTQMESKSGGG